MLFSYTKKHSDLLYHRGTFFAIKCERKIEKSDRNFLSLSMCNLNWIYLEKRLKFWENLGFKLIDIDLDLFDVLYSPCILSLKDTRRKDEELVNYGFMLYEAVLGKEEVNKHCFIVKD